jgi:proton-translocating NAD(P)+ transhydrogenase subunit alpha
MKLAIAKEKRPGEARVAATPETVKKLKALGADLTVEAGAGAGAHIADQLFRDAGAQIAGSAAEAFQDADVVFKVLRPLDEELALMKRGTMLVAILSPYGDREGVQKYAAAGVNAFAMEFMPRITRAQSMDVLSSQSNLAGYKSVIEAAHLFERAFPQMMTAAGTIAPARVFVMGAGVAGLQAIATARRLGARVSATDVRLAAKEQVASLGAAFVMVEDEETKAAETAAGYAKEMSEAYKAKQAALIAETIAKQDIVITTALIPGRPAPKLVTEEMVRSMKPGSVIMDLAAEQGGNVALTKPGEIVEVNGVRIAGLLNLAGQLPVDASALYAKNLLNFIAPLIDKETKALKIDWEDEIVKGTALTRDGAVIHPALKS